MAMCSKNKYHRTHLCLCQPWPPIKSNNLPWQALTEPPPEPKRADLEVNQELRHHWAGDSLGWDEYRWRYMNSKPWVLTFSHWGDPPHFLIGIKAGSESCLTATRALPRGDWPYSWISLWPLEWTCWKHAFGIHLLPRTVSVQELCVPCKHHPFRYDFRPFLQGHCLQPHRLPTA